MAKARKDPRLVRGHCTTLVESMFREARGLRRGCQDDRRGARVGETCAASIRTAFSRIPRYVELFESGEAKVRPNVAVAQPPRAAIVHHRCRRRAGPRSR